ncbi:MAG: YesL family protein, partial [Anaerolineae bacterium]|nr:YesL family protein [Anaerolineae bacterium]
MRKTETQGKYDGLMEQLERGGTFVLSNFAWVIFALPIITIPLGTVGLFQVMSMWVRGKQPEFFKDFFSAIRRLWLRAMIVGLLDAACVGFIAFNVQVLSQMDFTNLLAIMARSATLFAAVL